MKVKIFMDANPGELEEKCNAWLASEDKIRVHQINTHFGSSLESSQGGSTYWTGFSYLTMLYERTEASGKRAGFGA